MIALTLAPYGPGIHRGMSFAEYAAIKAVNKSSLALVADSPADCLRSLKGEYRKDSSGFALGSALDDLLTGGMTEEQFAAAHPTGGTCSAILASGKRKGQACGCATPSRYGDAWLCGKHNAEQTPTFTAALTPDDMAACYGMAKAMLDSDCRPLFDGCKGNQIVVLWHDKETGLPCKARLDGWSACQLSGSEQVESCHFDVKQTKATTPHEFAREAQKYAYFLQESHYLSGCQALDNLAGRSYVSRRFVFAVACNTPYTPAGLHSAWVWEYSNEAKEKADMERMYLMRKLKHCLDAGNFPEKKIKGVQTGELSDYALNYMTEEQP
jgi:hypothetical protein